MKYKRYFFPGGTYFFTVVTYHRIPIFFEEKAIDLLRESFSITKDQFPFTIDAICILPDHLHTIWTLPKDDIDFPKRWRWIKSHFSKNYSSTLHPISASHQNKGEKEIWQRRYWEHYIRDETDLTNHINYIHYNPVKHGYSTTPLEWKHSSFHQYVKDGILPMEWGTANIDIPQFGYGEE